MNFVGIFSAILLLFGFVQGQKDPICKNDPVATGECKQMISGYTFTPENNSCSSHSANACKVTGNFFITRQQCEEKCRDDFSWSKFILQGYSAMFQLQDNFLNLMRRIS
ncbi:kunitz-type serine protease inhibitor C6 [Drosophila rhopaloa]|uniref:Kunitz-type serine protease inhibitor C6-like n=1 Tax=Drosophila rhopaloa TaxID=1041015 RepID=A0A6P4F669_DRORH|nr:kunitz-type serine protease inhibitor C6 [Drosophila rhopaloa]